MENVNVSIFASAVRPKLWESCLSSFNSTSCSFEVVFGGFNTPEEVKPFIDKYPFFKYVHTANIKPSQVYEVTRRACSGETVVWFCDDAEVPNDVIGKAYKYWKSKRNEKLILSIQTKESGYNLPQGALFDMDNHRFFGYDKSSPLMAPLGMMSRKFLDELGGYDQRYISGQTENDVVMRAYLKGGKVEVFGDKDCYIDIDHLAKSILIGESKNERDFLNRPFAKGYDHDRKVLEKSWNTAGGMMIRCDEFIPFKDKDILTKSQGAKGIWD